MTQAVAQPVIAQTVKAHGAQRQGNRIESSETAFREAVGSPDRETAGKDGISAREQPDRWHKANAKLEAAVSALHQPKAKCGEAGTHTAIEVTDAAEEDVDAQDDTTADGSDDPAASILSLLGIKDPPLVPPGKTVAESGGDEPTGKGAQQPADALSEAGAKDSSMVETTLKSAEEDGTASKPEAKAVHPAVIAASTAVVTPKATTAAQNAEGQNTATKAKPASSSAAPASDPTLSEPALQAGRGVENRIGKSDQKDARDPSSRAPDDRQATISKASVVAEQNIPAPASQQNSVNITAISDAIATDPLWRAALSGPAPIAAATAAPAPGPLRSLKIELRPQELGVVTATLSFVDEHLSIDLKVETSEAYHRLNADSDDIVKALRALGFDVDKVSVQQPQAANATANRSDGNAGAQGGFARDAQSFASGSSGGNGDRLGSQENGRGQNGDPQRDKVGSASDARVERGVYI